jgi:hypothetical protein
VTIRRRFCFFPLLPVLGALALGARDGSAQQVRVRVVDEHFRAAIVGAEATLLTPDSVEMDRSTSGPDGYFLLTAPAPGPYLIRVSQMGYFPDTRPVNLEEGYNVIPAFVLYIEAIPLDTLEVEFSPSDLSRLGTMGPTRRAHVMSGERMAFMEEVGVSFFGAVRQLSASLSFRPVGRMFTCIESRRRSLSISEDPDACYNVAIVIDGVDTGMVGESALLFLHTLRVSDWESIEYLSPMEAGFRYGMLASSRGALVLWTRGRGPHRSPLRGGGM